MSLSYLQLEGSTGYILLENGSQIILGPSLNEFGGISNSGVENFANTTPGSAIGVVAEAAETGEAGTGVGGSGAIVTYSTQPYTYSYMLLEASAGYVLLESGGKIILGASP